MPYGKNELTPVELCRARSVLRQQVAAMLRGSLGPLRGYEPDDDPDREPAVNADTIIRTLTEPEAPGPSL